MLDAMYTHHCLININRHPVLTARKRWGKMRAIRSLLAAANRASARVAGQLERNRIAASRLSIPLLKWGESVSRKLTVKDKSPCYFRLDMGDRESVLTFILQRVHGDPELLISFDSLPSRSECVFCVSTMSLR